MLSLTFIQFTILFLSTYVGVNRTESRHTGNGSQILDWIGSDNRRNQTTDYNPASRASYKSTTPSQHAPTPTEHYNHNHQRPHMYGDPYHHDSKSTHAIHPQYQSYGPPLPHPRLGYKRPTSPSYPLNSGQSPPPAYNYHSPPHGYPPQAHGYPLHSPQNEYPRLLPSHRYPPPPSLRYLPQLTTNHQPHLPRSPIRRYPSVSILRNKFSSPYRYHKFNLILLRSVLLRRCQLYTSPRRKSHRTTRQSHVRNSFQLFKRKPILRPKKKAPWRPTKLVLLTTPSQISSIHHSVAPNRASRSTGEVSTTILWKTHVRNFINKGIKRRPSFAVEVRWMGKKKDGYRRKKTRHSENIASCLVNNYITFVGYCLKFIPTPLAWNDAETYCQQDGGHLVSPDTPEKFSKLSNLYKNDINIWIGGHLSELNGEYRWTSGEHFDPSLWNTGEPNMCYGIERCSLVLKTGKLNDKDCDAKYPFICELTIN